MTNEIEKKYLLSEDGNLYLPEITSKNRDIILLTPMLMAYLADSCPLRQSKALGDILQSAYQTFGSNNPVFSGASILEQGYLPIGVGKSLSDRLGLDANGIAEARLRRKANFFDGLDKYVFTLKSDGTLSRKEQETEVDSVTYEEFAKQFTGLIRKIRVNHPTQGLEAEVDFYLNRNLITAEVECPSIDVANQLASFGKDITEDKKYKNKNLAIPL